MFVDGIVTNVPPVEEFEWDKSEINDQCTLYDQRINITKINIFSQLQRGVATFLLNPCNLRALKRLIKTDQAVKDNFCRSISAQRERITHSQTPSC